MAKYLSLVFVGVIAVALLKCAAAQTTVHVVGGDMGWTVPSGGSEAYDNWAADKTFVVGDTLIFNFTTGQHDVQEVPKESYDGCTSSNTIASPINTGPANITLQSAGDKYYICTFGSHCQNGQKLAITVSATPGGSPSPRSTPTPSPPTSPSPSGTPEACPPTSGPTASGPTGSNTPSNPSGGLPDSSSSVALASVLVSMLAVVMGFLF